MTNAESLASLVEALGGTPSGTTNKALLAEAVEALGGTPSPGDTNDELIAKIAENASGGGGAWRLWSGDPEAEPLNDATTKKWLVDCEIYVAVTNVAEEAPSLPLEGRYFARKGDAADRPLEICGGLWVEAEGQWYLPLVGYLALRSLTPEEGGVAVTGEAILTDADSSKYWYETVQTIDTSLAFNDESQPDRIMVWIR